MWPVASAKGCRGDHRFQARTLSTRNPWPHRAEFTIRISPGSTLALADPHSCIRRRVPRLTARAPEAPYAKMRIENSALSTSCDTFLARAANH